MSLQEANERQQRISQLRAQRIQQQKANVHEDNKEGNINNNNNNKKEPVTFEPTDEQTNLGIFPISSNESIEVIARNIQDKVFQKAQEVADYASETFVFDDDPDNSIKTSIYDKDIKESMTREFQLAELRTNRAINKILQQKYTQN